VTRSFRAQLTTRFTATMGLAAAVLAVSGYFAVRAVLDRQIEASLLTIASIQASALTDDPTGVMHLHEWALTPDEAQSLHDVTRYVQVWSDAGESLIRSRYLTHDLPLDRSALSRASLGDIVWRSSKLDGIPVRTLYYPLGRMGPDHAPHVLQVAAPLEARDRTLATLRYVLAGTLVLVVVGTFSGSWWQSRRVMRPVHEIIDQTEEIEPGSLGQRISADVATREYERLVRVLNTMLARVDAAIDAQKRFTADASHELRSPLTALRGELELALRKERPPEEYRRVIASALEETDRLTALSANLLTLARSDAGVMQPRPEPLEVVERIRECLAKIRTPAHEKEITLALDASPPVQAACDPVLIDRLLWNLLDNAIKFTPPGGRVEVRAGSTSRGTIEIEVSDTGPGIREGMEDRVFERFRQEDSSRGAREGAGLGLAIVKAIAQAHGGSVAAENRPEGGSRFRVTLPTGEPAREISARA